MPAGVQCPLHPSCDSLHVCVANHHEIREHTHIQPAISVLADVAMLPIIDTQSQRRRSGNRTIIMKSTHSHSQ